MNERANRIKKLVMESEKTYGELEKMTGVSKSSLQRYASGTTSKIPLDVIEKLEKAFGVPRGYIMGWDEGSTNEKTATQKDSGMSESKRELLALAESCTDEEASRLLQMVELFLGKR